jgi:RNA polymerase sigma-70 factor (ECF subfamily)
MHNQVTAKNTKTADCFMPLDTDLKSLFSEGVEANMDSIYSLALRLTRNNADAEDLVAEAVSKAWASIKNLENPDRFRPWLFRIVHNAFISDYRKKSVRPAETSYDEASPGEGDVTAVLVHQPNAFLNWWANPEKAFFNNLLGEEINDAIDRLPECFRVAIILINIEGLSYDEAAEVLNVSPGTIRSRMNRGRTLLQRELWQYANEAGLTTPDNAAGK